MNDEQILELFHGGECERAFNEIVKNYSEPLYWHVRSLVDSHEDTDDLLQEIFVKIWTALPSFRGEARLFTWLYRIATNEAINFLNRQRLKSALSFQSLDSVSQIRIDSDPFFDGDKAQRLLCKAVATLPPKQKAVFNMRYYDDMKYEDIASIMGVSVGSLKASYHIAYEKVMNFLKKNATDF